MNKASVAAKEHAIQTKGIAGTTDTFIAKQKIVQAELEKTAVSTKIASVGIETLRTAFNMFAGMAIMLGITKIIEGFNYLSQSAERAKEKLSEIQTELSDDSSSYESNRKTLVGLQEEYDALTKKAKTLGGVQNLANDEYERYKEITSQILGITPKLTTGWNDEGEAISNKNNLLQESIDLLDEEYEKSLRNNTTKSKNEKVASGVIVKLDEFDSKADTKTKSGTIHKMYTDFFNELRGVKNNKLDDYQIAKQIYEYLYPNGKGLKSPNVNSDWFGSLWNEIDKLNDWEKLADSFIDPNNPIYNLFSDEVIDNMIRNADAYFAEGQRIIDERETLYQDYKDQLNWNAQATKDKNGNNAYKQLSDNGKAFINEYIEGLDYASIKTEDDFVEMANDVQKFTKLLASNGDISQLVESIFTSPKEDETSEQYIERVQTAITNIQKYCKENYIDLPINFKTLDDVNRMQQGVKALLDDEFDNKVGELTLDELQTAADLEIPEGTLLSWDELIAKIKEAKTASSDNETTISFFDAFNSADFSTAKEKLLELAAAGELTPETISSTEEYNTLLTKTKLSAEDACESINEAVSAAQRLNHTASGLSSLTDIYKQANEDGFADIESLYKLDDAFKNLDSYNEFVEIVGSGTHEMGEMQQIFDKLSSEYLEHTKVLDGLNESNKNLYIQQLRSYGIANAQEIVSKKLSEIDYSDAINSYFNANKGSEGWCNSQQKLNNLLKNETGSTLADFTNGNYEAQVSLLNESEASDTCRKAVAELQLAQIKFNQTKLSVDENIESLARYASAWGLTRTSAQAAYDQMKRVKEMQEGGAEGVGLMYTPEQLEDMYNDAQNRTDAHFAKLLKDDTTTASYNGDDDYRKEQAEKAKKESEKSKEIFDWIETKINRLKTVISELGETASNTFKSLAERASAYGNEISKVTEEIQLQRDAYSKYMEKAGSVGLSEEWASKVRDGLLDISEITDDTLKEQIKDYQTW